MLSRRRAIAIWLAGTVIGIAVSLIALPQPVAAQPSDMKKLTPELVLSVGGFRILNDLVVLRLDKSNAEALIWFMNGLRTTLMAANDAYVSAGAKRRVCIPSEVSPGELLDAINDELDRNEAYWETRKEESIVPLALQVFARKWPCK